MNSKYFRLSWSFMTVVFSIIFDNVTLSAQVTISEQKWIVPTYKVIAPDKNPIFFKNESYQGASRYIYPYGLIDVITNEKEDHTHKLQNIH